MTDMRDTVRDMSDPPAGIWLGLTEAAAVLGRSGKTLERWIRANKVETRKVGSAGDVGGWGRFGLWDGGG